MYGPRLVVLLSGGGFLITFGFSVPNALEPSPRMVSNVTQEFLPPLVRKL